MEELEASRKRPGRAWNTIYSFQDPLDPLNRVLHKTPIYATTKTPEPLPDAPILVSPPASCDLAKKIEPPPPKFGEYEDENADIGDELLMEAAQEMSEITKTTRDVYSSEHSPDRMLEGTTREEREIRLSEKLDESLAAAPLPAKLVLPLPTPQPNCQLFSPRTDPAAAAGLSPIPLFHLH